MILRPLFCLLLLAAPAAAQARIGADEAYDHVSDTLPPPPPVYALVAGRQDAGRLVRFGSDSSEDNWVYVGRAGETVTITLRAERFTPALAVWLPVAEAPLASVDGGGPESRVTLTLPEDGEYHVHAGASGPGETGVYVIHLESSLGADTSAVTARDFPHRVLWPGASVGGWLRGEFPFDAWSYDGLAGETITLRMEAANFPPSLGILWLSGTREKEIGAVHGRSGAAEVTVTLPADDTYVVQVGGPRTGPGGEYRLSLRRH